MICSLRRWSYARGGRRGIPQAEHAVEPTSIEESASTEKRNRVAKLSIYARERIPHAWLVNPVLRTLEVLRLPSDRWLTVAVHHDDQRVRAEPFDAIELDLAILWSDLEPPPPT
jgi:Uma2 family endonuclease